ncbi:Tat pathway signal protein [Hydrogenophaga sp.]|uniref:Acg family FMN-binding oxidoreductase n=1 Tax=Hydrogenophaga sp. TaxID=1904254 RepID=UPI00271EF4E6|nr:Tat pathway signal protein [Hydrogenophaga sp.]MDO8906741.1 Tat pathway signal protein [Hydrogenophaga sp.]
MVNKLTRRKWLAAAPGMLGGAAAFSASPSAWAAESYEAATARIWRAGPLKGLSGAALSQELVRYATLAPSSHNTQCWKFALDGQSITILPDFARRCPVVDPDDHHLYVSLGCAAENLVLAAQAWGLGSEVRFDSAHDAVVVTLSTAPAVATPLFNAIPERQCTRGDYDGKPLSAQDLNLLERAGSNDRVRLLLLTEKSAIERVLDFVVQGNTAQLNDKAFINELKSWIRYSASDAVARGDGLFGKSSGNPTIPSWLGDLMFDFVVTAKSENQKYTRQLRNSAGVAVFVAAQEDKSHWVDVGRAYERFALQGTVMGVRHAHLNMPVELASLRPRFASAIGLGNQRPDLVIRFGRGPTMPPSLRRPVQAVLV